MGERIGLLGLGAYVPERVMTNEDWEQYVDTTDEWITVRTGIKERRIAADHESTADLAVEAAKAALADAGVDAEELDEIILATDTPEAVCPDTAAFVHDRIGARGIPAYDLGGSGCAGFVLSLDIARSRAAGGRRVLVIGVEVITRLMDWYDRRTCVLFGDAAGAAVIGESPDAAELIAFTAGTDGSKAEILGLLTGGTRAPFTVERGQLGEHNYITMNGREVFVQAVKRMSAAGHEVLTKAGVDLDDVALIIPHQANMRIIDATRKELGLSPERVFSNLQYYGNTGSASIPLAMWDARNRGLINPGDLVLLTAFGAGFHWSAALVRF